MANGRGSLGLGRMNCDSSMFGPARLGEKKISKRNAVRTAPSVVSLIQRSRRTARLVTAERRSMEQTLAATIRPVPSFMRRQRRLPPASIRLGSVELARPRVSRS